MRTKAFLQFFTGIVLLFTLMIVTGCPPAPLPSEEPDTTAVEAPEEPEKVVCLTPTVDSENLRATPNGKKVGEVARGDTLVLVQRRGNWCEVNHLVLGDCFIWAQSVGFNRINECDLNWLLNGNKGYASLDSIVAVFGEPSKLTVEGGVLVHASYFAVNKDKSLLLGTTRFKEIILVADLETRAILEVTITLSPFEGDLDQMLAFLGLPKTKSTGSDFERVRFKSRFKGIALMELLRYQGDFTKYGAVQAWKYPQRRWATNVEITTKDVDYNAPGIVVTVGMRNNSNSLAFAGPFIELGVYEDTRVIGNYTLGPGNLRLDPHETSSAMFPVFDLGQEIDPHKLNLTAKLVDMSEVPVSE